MKKKYDFSNGVRSKFFDPKARLCLPVYLDENLRAVVEERARKERCEVSTLVNRLLKRQITLGIALLLSVLFLAFAAGTARAEPDWKQQTAAAAWSARYAHTSVVFNNKLWVLGGYDGAYKNDVWSSYGALTLDPGAALTLGQHFTNNGSFSAAAISTVTLNGSGLQIVGGDQDTTFGNLTMAHTGKVRFGDMNVGRTTKVAGAISWQSGSVTIGYGGGGVDYPHIWEVPAATFTRPAGWEFSLMAGSQWKRYR